MGFTDRNKDGTAGPGPRWGWLAWDALIGLAALPNAISAAAPIPFLNVSN